MINAGGTFRYRAGDFPERRVVLLWQDCPGRDDLETEEDGPIKVLYPGRINDDSGADYRDAVVATSRGLLTGDIEIHTRSSQWWEHRHHLDPIYNRVVLHVVFRRDIAKAVRLENGREIPTLALESLFRQNSEPSLLAIPPVPCSGIAVMRNADFLAGILDMAGEQRFLSRAAGYQTVSSQEETGQSLYRGIMAALGYAKNEHAMAELACRMPLRRLERLVTANAPATECLARYQAMLMGSAGFLPSQVAVWREKNSAWIDRLEKLWTASGDAITMSLRDWHFFRVRPGNAPARRIAAMSRLLLRYRHEGLLDGLIGRFDNLATGDNCRALEDAFFIGGGDDGSGLTESCRCGRNSETLLGRDRAADIVINVFLPFAVAWGRVNTRPKIVKKAIEIYRRYPAPATNTLVRHMSRQLGIAGSTVNTARRQQGLLHIFKTLCSRGGCQNCPVKRAVKRSPGDAR